MKCFSTCESIISTELPLDPQLLCDYDMLSPDPRRVRIGREELSSPWPFGKQLNFWPFEDPDSPQHIDQAQRENFRAVRGQVAQKIQLWRDESRGN